MIEFHKTYYFDTKRQRVSSASYLRELLYSMFTMLQTTRTPYISHPAPQLSIPNVSQRNCVGYQILLTWQEFHEKLLQSLDEEKISSWTLEELSIWWAITRFLYACLMEFALKNGWGVYIKYKENPEYLLKQYRICENTFRNDSHYANSIHVSYNELFVPDYAPCNLEKAKTAIPVIEGKVLLNSQQDFNYLFGIDRSYLLDSGTKISHENSEVINLKKLLGLVQEHVKPLKQLLVQNR